MATTTIVTAIVSDANSHRGIETYVVLGTKLLLQPIPTVCFIEKDVYFEHFHHKAKHFPQTIFRLFEKTDNYIYVRKEELSSFNPITDNPGKDTREYMCIQCHKTEWVKMAIEMNPFHTEQFIWVDFGIFHMISSEDKFALHLQTMANKRYQGVRMASCWDLSNESKECTLMQKVHWYFAGSIFGGDKGNLLSFAALMKTAVNQMITEKKSLTWEINVWYMLYKNHKTLFLPYFSRHDCTILDNY